MNANELADDMEGGRFNDINYNKKKAADFVRQQQEQINNLKQWEKRQLDLIETQQAEIEELKTCLIVEQEHNERMVEDRSKYEALAHVGGVEAGKKLAQAEIEALKQIIDANNLSQNIGQFVKPDLKIEEVMSEHCACYKLGYNPLNDYRKVKAK